MTLTFGLKDGRELSNDVRRPSFDIAVSEYSYQSVCVCSTEVVKETKRVYKHVDALMSDVRKSVVIILR